MDQIKGIINHYHINELIKIDAENNLKSEKFKINNLEFQLEKQKEFTKI